MHCRTCMSSCWPGSSVSKRKRTSWQGLERIMDASWSTMRPRHPRWPSRRSSCSRRRQRPCSNCRRQRTCGTSLSPNCKASGPFSQLESSALELHELLLFQSNAAPAESRYQHKVAKAGQLRAIIFRGLRQSDNSMKRSWAQMS